MSKIKKLVLSMFFVLVACCGLVFSACTENDDNMNIKLSTNNVQIVLGENDNIAKLTAKVSNAKTLDVIVDYDSADIKVDAVYIKDGITEITVEAYRQCTDIEVTVKGTKKSVSFFVNATTPITSISAKKEVHYMAYDVDASDVGGQYLLSNDLIQIYPQDTKQTEVVFSLSNTYPGVSIENNYLKIEKGLAVVPSVIDVDAVSIYNETVKATLHFQVVKAIDVNQISILDGVTFAEALSQYEINKTNNIVSLQVAIPFDVYDKELNVKPIFKYNDTGIGWDTKSVEKDILNSVYRYTFDFSYTNTSSKETIAVDEVWFEISYIEYPEIKTSTLNLIKDDECVGIIKITKINEITDVAYFVDGVISTATAFDVYTTYKNVASKGLEIQFATVPANATSRDLALYVDANNPSLAFLNIKNSEGRLIQFANGKYEFTAGDKFYFMAQTGFSEDASVDITIKSEVNAEIQKTITIYLQEGITRFGFKEGLDVVENTTFYLENNEESEYFERTIIFAHSPISVNAEKFSVIVEGDVFESDCQITENEAYNDQDQIKYHDVKIKAIKGVTGQGTLKIRFQSGQEISAKVIVIERLSSATIDVDTSVSISSAIGNIEYQDGGVSYVAIKFGKSLPIKFSANSKIISMSYKFSDKLYNQDFDVYNEDGEYGSFDNNSLQDKNGDPIIYRESSAIVRPDILRTTQTISPTEIGKVWIQVTFRGECLTEDYRYAMTEISEFICVEVYNPVESIDVSSKNIEVYALDEVGRANSNLAKHNITIELNKNSAYKPTYNKILWAGQVIDEANPYVYVAVGTEIDILKIEKIETSKYLLTVLTKSIPDLPPITFHSVDLTAPDITGESTFWSKTINISIKDAISTSEIIPTNVPTYANKVICEHCNQAVSNEQVNCSVCNQTVKSTDNYYIYLMAKSVSTQLTDNNFKILTKVLPDNALNKRVVYEFVPDPGTNQNIVSISLDGVVSVNGDIGGTGIIRILPEDSILEDALGHQYYREGAPSVNIRLVVADGGSKETAIVVSELSQIKNPALHYVLQYKQYATNKVLFDTFSGGLYGQSEYSDNNAIIALQDTTLFNTLSMEAVVEDLILCGTTQTGTTKFNINSSEVVVGGLLTNVNNGTIKNIVVDLIDNKQISTITSTRAGYTGGLVGVNNGTIQNSTFAGSVINNAGVVGGLVGANYGIITKSNVLIYNFKDGETEMVLQGSTVGGLVGELFGNSTIEQSYVYNFSTTNQMATLTNYGAIVGQISSTKALIKECFAQVGNNSNFYSSLGDAIEESALKNIIKNSYVLFANGDNYNFAYYMTQKNGAYLIGTATEINAVYSNVSFGASYVWNVSSSKNYGYPYLNNVRPVEKLTDLTNLKIQKTALSLQEENNTAVMYLYKTKNIVLTEKENNLLNVANTLSFAEMFGTNNINGIMVTSSDESIISTSLNSVIIKNTGVVTLTIQSKYDLSIDAKQVTVCVLYHTSNLSLKIGSTVLGDRSVFNIKVRTTQKVTSLLQNTIVLFDREIAIMENDYIVNFYQTGAKSPYVVGDKIGTHVVSATFTGETAVFDVFLSLSLDKYNFDSEETRGFVQNIIKTNSLKQITAQKVYGPNAVTTTISKATISPSDSLIFDVVISSDRINESLQYMIFDSNDRVVTDIFEINETLLTNDSYNTKYNIQLNIIRENIEDIVTGEYTLRFLTISPSVYADVKINIIAQEVIRVDVNNYAQSGTLLEGTTYNYYPSNVITPNSSSLLDITLYPAYAEYTHITVTSQPVNNESLALISMRKGYKAGESTSAYYVDSANNSEFIENGVKIYKKITDDEIARYYVRVIASSAILVDSSYDIYIDVYNGTELVYTQVYTLVVMPQEKPGLSVNGKDKIFALLGEEITVDIIKAKDQTLKQNYYLSDNRGATVVFNNDWTNYSTEYERATFTLYISDTVITDFIFTVQTSAFINGKEEVTQSSIYVYIIPFELDINNTHIKNQQGNDVAVGDTYFNHELDFAFAGKYTNAGLDAFTMFTNQGYYIGDDYIVNTEAKIYENPFKYGLYFVNNNNSYTPITNTEKTDSIITFSFNTDETGKERIYFLGNMLGTQRMLLEIKVQMPDGTIYTHKYFFTIQIKSELNDDEPTQINSASEFLEIFNNQDEEHYILMKDIELYEYTPAVDTSKIASFDGNGFTISIMSYNYDELDTSANYALFETVSDNTTIKNLRLNVYNINEIALNSSTTSEVNIATVAVTNQGIITNAEVVSYRSNRASDVIPAISGMNITIDSTINVVSRTAGFVINNFGVITNSHVGGEITTEYKVNKTYGSVTTKTVTLSPFVISSFGEVAGFVHTNTGHITSSYASNIRVINNSNIDYATLTAGFAIYNQGIISMSYAKGVKTKATDVHADKYGIETTGIAAGFIYSNSGTISDCYSNITLTNLNNPGRASAGFVFLNRQDATVEKSLSLSRIIGSTTTQMNFVGVNEWGTYQNDGIVENSYYYDEVAMDDDSILVEKAYGESAREVGAVTLKDYFYGFNFTTDSGNDEDGIWKMTPSGPDLVSANSRTVSLRYTSPLSTSEKPKTTYVDDYRYGSKNNPILIRSASEFNEVFAGTVNKSSSLFVNTITKEVFGNYRIIKDIDLQELTAETDTYRLASSQMELTGNNSTAGNNQSIGKIDGNGFTIKGFALSDASASVEIENFGMFAKITNGAIIMNLNIVIGATNKEGEIFGVEAKNIINVGALAGTVADSKVVNVNLTSLYENTNSVTVRGKNIVGGLIGKVDGNSYICNIVTTDVSVTAVNYPENYTLGSDYGTFNSYSRLGNEYNKSTSYAGGIIGAFDAYTSNTKNVYTFSDAVVSSNSNGIMLKTKGVMQITGGTVGGIVGYIGPLTIIQDALLDLAYIEDDSQQGLYSYNGFAGGIAGYNLGYLRQVRAEHNNTLILKDKDNLTYQDAIEKGMALYYEQEDVSLLEKGNEVLFHNNNYYPIAIGGLVGLQKSGKIEKSYSKINVMTTNGFDLTNGFAGGVVGVIGPQEGDEPASTLHEVYASGDVRQSVAVAGIVGRDQNDKSANPTKYEKVNAVNYWGKWILETNNVSIYAFANGITNGLEKSASRNLFADLCSLIPGDENREAREQLEAKLSEYVFLNQGEDTPKYTDMNGVGDDGELFDEIFKGNDWDSNSWSRDEDELFPHILFGYHSNVEYIRNQNDIEKLRTNDETTAGNKTYVIDPDDSADNINKNGVKLITVDKKFAPIVGFCNVLRGVDDKAEYGFNFVDKNQTKALFKSTLNATFKDFSVYYNYGEQDSNINFTNASAQGATFVEVANNTDFINLKFSDITMKNIATTRSTFGIACGVAKGSTSFNGVEFNNCQILLDSNSQTINTGMLFGSGTIASGSINNIKFANCSINLSEGKVIGTDDSSNKSNIGTIGGVINYTGTEFSQMNVVIAAVGTSAETGANYIQPFASTINCGSGSVLKNVYLGGVFGSSNRVNVRGSKDQKNNTFSSADITFDIDSIVSSDVGGLVGNIRQGGVGEISVIPNIQINKSLNSNVGGVCGVANYTTFDSINVGSYKQLADGDEVLGIQRTGLLDCNNIVQNDEIGNISANFGGVVGKFDNTASEVSTISAIRTYLDIDLGINAQESAGAKSVTLYVGSIVGNANNIVLEDNGSYGDITTRNYYVESKLYVGGLIGKANNTKLVKVTKEVQNINGRLESVDLYNYSTGNLKNIVCYMGSSGLSTLAMSGLVAQASGEIILDGCVAAGNTYPTYKEVKVEGEVINDIANDIFAINYSDLPNGENQVSNPQGYKANTNFIYGGLIATVEEGANVTMIANYSIDTLVNKVEERIAETYIANVFVGNATNSESYKYLDATQEGIDLSNRYSHVYTLVLNNNQIGETEKYIANTPLSDVNMIDVIRDRVNIEDGYFIKGSKINYNTAIENDLVENQYIFISNNISFEKGLTLINSVIVSDGQEITFEPLDESPKSAIFNEIDANSIVSGLVINANYSINDSGVSTYNEVAGFVNKNQGIIYTSVVRGRKVAGQKVTGYIQSNKKVAGFVANNIGLIKDCYTDLSIVSYYGIGSNKATEVAAAAFALANTGYIVTSYSAGSIQNYKLNSSDVSNSKIYTFAPGNVYGCYTITKVIDSDITSTDSKIIAFGDKEGKEEVNKELCIKNSFYDSNAIEAKAQDTSIKNYSKQTNDVAVGYASDSGVYTKNPSGDTSKYSYVGDLICNVNYAYGYGSFCDGAFKNIEYIKHPTGTGSLTDYYQIPNIGKLKQIPESADKYTYYRLIQDIDGKYISDFISAKENKDWLEWKSKNVSNIELDGEEIVIGGSNHSIKNVIIKDGGLFGDVNKSTFKNLKIEKLIVSSIKAEDESTFGLLANKADNTTITNLYVEQTLDFLTSITINSSTQTVKFGFVVGEFTQTDNSKPSIISSCNVHMVSVGNSTSSETNGVNLNNTLQIKEGSKSRNWTIGGIIGKLSGGLATQLQLSDSQFYIDFNQEIVPVDRMYKTYIVGGIVGEQTGGAITSSVLNSRIDAFTSEFNSGSNLYLYVGGIVGKIDSTAVAYAEGNLSNVDSCMTQQGSQVSGGNHYSFRNVYVGGICGYGGIITNCKNSASIYSYAAYLYAQGGGSEPEKPNGYSSAFTNGLTSAYSLYNKSISGMSHLIKLLYAKTTQNAHAAGIANEYTKLENCINKSKIIKGGMESKNLHSYYYIDTAKLGKKAAGANIVHFIGVNAYRINDILDEIVHFKIPANIIKAAMLVMIGVGIQQATTTFIDIQEYNMNSMGYEYLENDKQYFIEEVYKGFSILGNIFKYITITIPYIYSGNNVLPIGRPNPTRVGAIDRKLLSELSDNDYTKLNKYGTENSCYYSDEIQVRDVYFDALGLSSLTTPLNCYSAYQVYTPVTMDTDNNSATADEICYAIHDNSEIASEDSQGNNIMYKTTYEEYGIVYKDTNSAISKLTKVNLPDEESFGEDSGWEQIDGEWVISSVENNKADIKEFINGTNRNSVDIEEVKIEDSTKYIIKFDIYDLPGYNLMTEIVNKRLEIKDKYEGLFATAADAEKTKFNLLINGLNNLDHFEINIKVAELYGITAQLGTETYPFVGKFIGTKFYSDYTTLQSVKHSASATYGGLFAYAKNLEVENIVIEYSENQNYALTTNTETPVKAVGGIVGNLVIGGNLTVTNTVINYIFKDYYLEGKNNIISATPIAVGGIVGFADAGSKIAINKEVIIQNFDVETKSELGNTFITGSNHRLAIGSVVASMNDASLIIENEEQFVIDKININCESSHNIAGGIIGYSVTSQETLAEPNIVLQNINIKSGKISVNTLTGSNVIVGGLIGRIDGGAVKLSDIKLLVSNISAKTSSKQNVETYAGGLVGYVTEEDISGDGTIKVTNFIGLKLPDGQEDSNIILGDDQEYSIKRIFVTSGIGGKEYPLKAYADKYFGNAMLCTELTTERSNIFANVKCYSITKPNYTEYPKQNANNLTSEGIINSRNNHYEESVSEGKIMNYIKIDSYEYKTQVDSVARDAYVDGNQFVGYNYQKQYLISTIYMDKISSKHSLSDYGDIPSLGQGMDMPTTAGEDCYSFEEIFYLLTINGTISEDNDYNLVRNYKFELITSYTYSSSIDIYARYTNKAYPLTNRVKLDENGIGYYPDPSKSDVGQYMVNATTQRVVEDGEEREEIIITKIPVGDYKTSIEQTTTRRNTYNESINGTVNIISDLGFKLLYKSEAKKYTNLTVFKDSDNVVKLVLNYTKSNVDENGNESNETEQSPKNIILFHNVYSVGNTKSEIKYEVKATFTPNDIKQINTEQLLIDLGNGNTLPVSNLYESAEQSTYKLTVYMSNVFKVDGSDDRQRRMLIVSEFDDSLYNDKVYLIAGDTNLVVYYLGDIKYTTDTNDFTQRNDFFFPLSVDYYENNLLPLNSIAKDPDFKYIAEIESVKTEHLIILDNTIGTYIKQTNIISKKVYEVELELDLTKGIANISAEFVSTEKQATPTRQDNDEMTTSVTISGDSYEVNDVIGDDNTIKDETTGEIIGYTKSILVLQNGESREFKFIYDTTDTLQQVEETSGSQKSYYDAEGKILSYSNVQNVIWVKYDYSSNVTYYRFSALATGADDSDSYSLKGIFGFSYDSTTKSITAINKDSNNVGIKTIVFSSQGEHRISSITYTQNIKKIDASYTLFTITELYSENNSLVTIQNRDLKSIGYVIDEIAPSMNGISASSMHNLIKISLSDVIKKGEEYIKVNGFANPEYIKASDLTKFNIAEADSIIVYQQKAYPNEATIYLYEEGIYKIFPIIDKTMGGIFTDSTITDVTINDYIVISYSYDSGETGSVKLEMNVDRLNGFVFTGRTTNQTASLEADSSFVIKYETYNYEGATRFNIRDYGELIVYNQTGLSIKTLTPFDGEHGYSINLSNGQSYTLNGLYEINGDVTTEGEFYNETMFNVFSGEFVVYKNKASYTDSSGQTHNVDETLVYRKSIRFTGTLGTANTDIDASSPLLNKSTEATYDESGNQTGSTEHTIKTTKVERTISYDADAAMYIITDILTSAMDDAEATRGTDNPILYSVKVDEYKACIKLGISTDSVQTEYVYGKVQDATIGPNWSKVLKINGKNIFTAN